MNLPAEAAYTSSGSRLPVSSRWLVLLLMLASFLTGCRTPPKLPAINLNDPGWTQQQYQVVWKRSAEANELVCDVIEAHHPDGRAFLQVAKPPLTLATVRIEPPKWWVQYGPRPQFFSGDSVIGSTDLWVHVLTGKDAPDSGITHEVKSSQTQVWVNRKSGERIEGVPAR